MRHSGANVVKEWKRINGIFEMGKCHDKFGNSTNMSKEKKSINGY